jgi:Stress responsive A/B Barrel Domain
MFVHAVYFWLRDDLTSVQRDKFASGLRSLRGIEHVRHGYIGKPAPTDRPVIERGYSDSLVLVFADQKAHDAYQTHPVHDRFRADCGTFWSSIRIYDSIATDSTR